MPVFHLLAWLLNVYPLTTSCKFSIGLGVGVKMTCLLLLHIWCCTSLVSAFNCIGLSACLQNKWLFLMFLMWLLFILTILWYHCDGSLLVIFAVFFFVLMPLPFSDASGALFTGCVCLGYKIKCQFSRDFSIVFMLTQSNYILHRKG